MFAAHAQVCKQLPRTHYAVRLPITPRSLMVLDQDPELTLPLMASFEVCDWPRCIAKAEQRRYSQRLALTSHSYVLEFASFSQHTAGRERRKHITYARLVFVQAAHSENLFPSAFISTSPHLCFLRARKVRKSFFSHPLFSPSSLLLREQCSKVEFCVVGAKMDGWKSSPRLSNCSLFITETHMDIRV
jgi:hypothetical protein